MTPLTRTHALNTVLAAYAALPSPRDMAQMQVDARAAEARGYFDPVEDDRLRGHYARYLGVRVALYDAIDALGRRFKRFRGRRPRLEQQALQDFAVAFAGAEIIVRTGEYLIDLARDRGLVFDKLDEAEDRFGIPRLRFTRLYRQLTSARLMRPYYAARDYFDTHRAAVMEALSEPPYTAIATILSELNLPGASRGDHIRRYGGFVRHSLRRSGVSGMRQLVFQLFEMSGSWIADQKVPGFKPIGAPKRITPAQAARLREVLQPGDVLVTRHDDAASNLFLPGFWPHSALFIGEEEGWPEGVNPPPHSRYDPDGHGLTVLEAKKDGVLLRALEDTLQVDACVVLRPTLPPAQVAQAVARGISHAGKLYDFVFDFSVSDRLVCTEVIYRAFHGVGPVAFTLDQRAGRHCLSAEDLINQGVGAGWFEPVLLLNTQGQESWLEGDEARPALRATFASTF